MQVQVVLSRTRKARLAPGPRRSVVALLAAVAASAALAACSGGSSSTGAHGSGPASSTAPDSGLGEDAALRTAPMHGLVVVTKQWLTTAPSNIRLWLVGYDPQTGAPTATRYFSPTGGETMSFTEEQQPPYQRQSFAQDYTLVSATSGRDEGGVTHAGVVHTGDSRFTRLSSPVSGDRTERSAQAGPFNPRTGRLWFTRDGGTLGSVDPRAGAASERVERGAVQTMGGGIAWYGFTPTGFGPVWNTTGNLGSSWYFPNGQMMYGDTAGYAFGKQGAVGPRSRPVVALPDGVRGYPVAVVDDARFVLVDVAGTNLYLITHAAKKLTAVKLLPDSTAQITGAVVSPTHDQVAYRSSDSGVYVVGLTGRTPPRKVVEVPYGLTDRKAMLIDWVP